MPSITIDSYWTMYHELADRVYDFAEWGLNNSGRNSHTAAPGKCAQWDPTRQVVFNPLGINTTWGREISHRVLTTSIALEGPHQNGGELVFIPPTAQTTFTNAFLRLYPKYVLTGYVTRAWRIYGVASDNFCSRFVAPTYPATYKGEWQQVTYGASHYNRRYRADSIESDQEHTEAQVYWTQLESQVTGDGYAQTANIASVVNEIAGRAGWTQGNRLCLVLVPDLRGFTQEPYPPDWDAYSAPQGQDFYGCDGGENQPTLTLEW